MKEIVVEEGKSFYGRFYLRKDRVMAINRDGQKCNMNGKQEPIGRCIVRTLEEKFNCTSFQITANKSREFCSKGGGQLGLMNKAKEEYDRLSEADLVNQTGCLPSCGRYETGIESTP